MVISFWTGLEIGLVIANLIYFTFPNYTLFWAIMGVFAVANCFVVLMNINTHMIWVTALFGSYVFLLSSTLFYGRWPIDLNLPKLYEVGAIRFVDQNFYWYIGLWLLTACFGILFQCWHLWHFKKKGKVLKKQHLQEAIDKFEYGRTAEERKRDKEVRQFEKYVEQNIEV